MRDRKQGFTLLEMSIVLLVIGLLTGGVVAGQALLRNSQRMAMLAELQKFRQAFTVFVDRYAMPPGDFSGASALWGAAGGSGTGSSCFTVSSTNKAACDGNGDGQIWQAAGAVAGDVWRYGELYQAWKHLANAELIDGKFTGVNAGTTESAAFKPDVNAPHSAMKQYTYRLSYVSAAGSDIYVRDANDREFWGHILMPYHMTQNAMVNLALAKFIDDKLDDGLPGTGSVRGYTNCGTSSTTTDRYTARYDLTKTTLACTLFVYIPRADGSFY